VDIFGRSLDSLRSLETTKEYHRLSFRGSNISFPHTPVIPSEAEESQGITDRGYIGGSLDSLRSLETTKEYHRLSFRGSNISFPHTPVIPSEAEESQGITDRGYIWEVSRFAPLTRDDKGIPPIVIPREQHFLSAYPCHSERSRGISRDNQPIDHRENPRLHFVLFRMICVLKR